MTGSQIFVKRLHLLVIHWMTIYRKLVGDLSVQSLQKNIQKGKKRKGPTVEKKTEEWGDMKVLLSLESWQDITQDKLC